MTAKALKEQAQHNARKFLQQETDFFDQLEGLGVTHSSIRLKYKESAWELITPLLTLGYSLVDQIRIDDEELCVVITI